MRPVGRSRSEVELGSDLARPCLVPDRVGACRVVRESDIEAPPLPRPQRPASPRVVRLAIRICYRELRFAADRPRLLDRMRLGAGSSRTNSPILFKPWIAAAAADVATCSRHEVWGGAGKLLHPGQPQGQDAVVA